MCCAEAKRKGAIICDIQNSGFYGNNYCTFLSETKIWDRFITWGWNAPLFINETLIPVCMNRLPSMAKIKRDEHHAKRILYVGTTIETCDHGIGNDYSNYLERQPDFINTLNAQNKERLVIRLRGNRRKTELIKWCKMRFPSVKFEFSDEICFKDSLAKSDLMVCDYYGSPHIEALMLGFPFLMYDALNIYVRNSGISDVINKLDNLGVYKHDGSDLAKEINEHNNWEEWLDRKEVNDAYNAYQHRIAGNL